MPNYSVSLSGNGNIMAIGIHEATNNNTKSGRVRIYKSKSGVWSQVGHDIKGEAVGDYSGYSVSLSKDGTTVAIGAKHNHGRNGTNSGHVRVYKNNSGVWKQIGGDIDGEAEGDWSGYSVSLSGDGAIVAIGAVLNNGNGENSGHVRVYKNNSGVWTQVGADINGKAAKDYFGTSVSLSNNGSILAVGAHQGGVLTGYVSVYKNISGNWEQIGNDITGEPKDNFLGWNISLSSNGATVATAAYKDNKKGKRHAYVRMYQTKGGAWVQKGTDIDGKTTGYDVLGFNNISLGKDTITLLGAYDKDRGKHTPIINYVRVYKYNSSNIWKQINTDI
ncbi:WD40 repeat domain-containing protein [Flavivirga eckloniae]|nr:FG-GAP repeat protein [Flavivirga eckloniae]